MGYIENNVIAGVPKPGPYSLYIYFSDAHPRFCLINEIKIAKIYFIMFLINSQLDNVNTTLRLCHYDNRHKCE